MLRLVNTDLEMQRRLELLSVRTWHKERYKWVHCDLYQPLYFPDPKSDRASTMCYAVVKDNDPEDIVGYIQTNIQYNNLWLSCAINFTDDIITMANAFMDLIAMACHDNYHKIACSAMVDNPACRKYASLFYEMGGHMEGALRQHVKTWDNQYRDMEDFGLLLTEMKPKWNIRMQERYERRKDVMFY